MDLTTVHPVLSQVKELFSAQFHLELSWRDFRLEFFNLKKSVDMNTLSREEIQSIWVPRLVFVNTPGMASTHAVGGYITVLR